MDDSKKRPRTTDIRTYASDLARLVRENKLSPKELQKIPADVLEAIKKGEVHERVTLSAPVEPSSAELKDVKGLDLSDEEKKIPDDQSLPAEEIFDVDDVGESAVASNTPVEPAAPQKLEPQKAAQVVSQLQAAPQPVQPEQEKERGPKEKLAREEMKLGQEIAAIQRKEKDLVGREAMLTTDKTKAESESLAMKAKETEVEKQEAKIIDEERNTESLAQRRDLEKKRWTIEDERQRIEKARWNIDNRIGDLEERISEIGAEEKRVKAEEGKLARKLEGVRKQEIALQAKADKEIFLKKLEDIKRDRERLEREWKDLMESNTQAENAVAELEKKANIVRKEIDTIEVKEHKTAAPAKIHEFESERWEKDKNLRTIEQEMWKADEETARIAQRIADVEQKSQSVLLLEKNTNMKIAELDKLIADAEPADKKS